MENSKLTIHKKLLISALNSLKESGLISSESEVAKATGYTKSSLSVMKSLNNEKPVSYAFQKKFEAIYGINISDGPEPYQDKIKELETKLEVVFNSLTHIISTVTGKDASLIKAELNKAISLSKE